MNISIVIFLYFSVFLNGILSVSQSNSHLKYNDGSWRPVFEIVKRGNINDIREILTKKTFIDEPDELGDSALIWATVNRQREIFDLLIQYGANINYRNRDGDTALILAVDRGYKDVVEVLIQRGASVDIENENKLTAFLLAAKNGNKEIVQLMLKKGVNVDQTNRKGTTALMLATEQGHKDMVEYLLDKGANVSHANSDGDTAVHFSAKNSQREIGKLLGDRGGSFLTKNKYGKSPINIENEIFGSFFSRIYNDFIGLFKSKVSVAQKACDLYSNLLSVRIVGGEFADDLEFPWMTALGYMTESYKIYFGCGGTVISDYFVLTAAHCVVDNRPPVVVRMGKLSLLDDDGTRPENYQIRAIIKHPEYSVSEKKNDIALIRVVKRISFSEYVRPACLRIDKSDMDRAIDLKVTGWGKISNEAHNQSNILHKTDLQTMPLSRCNTILSNFNKGANLKSLRAGLNDGQYCAHDPIDRSDSCEGDSGGPLQFIRPNVTLATVVGIVSFGFSCGTALPSIYTRVAHYVNWIETHVWPNGEVNTPMIAPSDGVIVLY